MAGWLYAEDQREHVSQSVRRELRLQGESVVQQLLPGVALGARLLNAVLLEQVLAVEEHQRAGFLREADQLALDAGNIQQGLREVVQVVRLGVEQVGVTGKGLERSHKTSLAPDLKVVAGDAQDVPRIGLALHGRQHLGTAGRASRQLLDTHLDLALGVLREFGRQPCVGICFGATGDRDDNRAWRKLTASSFGGDNPRRLGSRCHSRDGRSPGRRRCGGRCGRRRTRRRSCSGCRFRRRRGLRGRGRRRRWCGRAARLEQTRG